MVRQTRIVNGQLAMELANSLPRKFEGVQCQPMEIKPGLFRVFIVGNYIPDGIFPYVDGYLAGRAVETPRITVAI